jgi:D-inositol-3-phosphate glycosyltransferase
MINLLWYSDFLVPTGFGNVAEEILSRLLKTNKYAVTVVAINYQGEPYNVPTSPYYKFKDVVVHPAMNEGDLLGRAKVLRMLNTGNYDVLFVLQDTFNMATIHNELTKAKRQHGFGYVYYFPVDSDLDRAWVYLGMMPADIPVTYTDYGRGRVNAVNSEVSVEVIPHGVDTAIFRPTSDEENIVFKKGFFGLEDEFLITNVNRNQQRKDIPSTILSWLKVKEVIPDARLYLHMAKLDPAGCNLDELVYALVPDAWRGHVIRPIETRLGCSKEIMRRIYCASDVIVTTTHGEGWGLSITEAMACGVPIVAPRHTACQEIIGKNEERGFLAEIAAHVVLLHFDNFRQRPLVDVSSMANKILEVYKKPEKAKMKAERAQAWVKEYCDWDKIAVRWDELITKASLLRAQRSESAIKESQSDTVREPYSATMG